MNKHVHVVVLYLANFIMKDEIVATVIPLLNPVWEYYRLLCSVLVV